MANITEKLDTVINEAAEELQEDLTLIKDFWKTYKRGGVKALAKSVPDLWDQIKYDKDLVREIKKANENLFKRPEFILITFFLAFNFSYLSITSEFVSSHINAPIAAILSIYTLANAYERVCRRNIEKDF